MDLTEAGLVTCHISSDKTIFDFSDLECASTNIIVDSKRILNDDFRLHYANVWLMKHGVIFWEPNFEFIGLFILCKSGRVNW